MQQGKLIEEFNYKPDNSLLLFPLVFLSLCLNFELTQSQSPIYICHVLWMIFLGVYFSSILLRISLPTLSENEIIIFLLFFVILFLHGSIGIYKGISLAFTEFAKYIFSFTLFFTLVLVLKNRLLNIKTIAFCIGSGLIISTFTLIETNPLALGSIDMVNRLDISRLGGFNTYSILIANSIMCFFYLYRTNNKTKILSIVYLLAMFYLFIVLLSTLSRNGMLGLFVSLATYSFIVFSKKNILIIFLGFLSILIFLVLQAIQLEESIFLWRYLFDENLLTGSGRLQVWTHLISRMFENPLTIIFGTGIGEINFEVLGGHSGIYSAHNQFLQFLYEFGFITFSMIIVFFLFIFKRLLLINDLNKKAFLVAILVQLCVSLLFDSTLQGSQVGWFFALWLSVLYTQSLLYKIDY